ncbi:MAG: amidohydrolase family protein [Ignavibacteriales bacterium]|nr:amidohydrolase family protein [Ignavibacteriales bacterium]
MILNNVYIIGKETNPSSIEITGSKIISIDSIKTKNGDQKNRIVINFDDAIAFPGLINSHDHLEFSLFPKLGNRIYNDYVEWGKDIHSVDNEKIKEVLKVPYELKYKWGLYKNLICGVTNVAHHGNGPANSYGNLPGLIKKYNYLHSIRLEKYWFYKLNLLFNGKPFVIHLGEGTNVESFNEINKLINKNVFKKKIIAVHGISMNETQSREFKALVWCPDSNIILYDKTATIDKLKINTKILFGTDSPLSADWNLWNHLRLARKMNCLGDEELYNSLTRTTAEIWNIKSYGSISINNSADIVVSKRKHKNGWDSFYDTNPEDILLILKHGLIVFIDKNLADQHRLLIENKFDLIIINSVQKYITKGIRELKESINKFLPEYQFPFEIN